MKSLQGENFDQNRLQFEQWLERRLRSTKQDRLQRQQSTYKIPVVVHVIHNGEPIGTGKNISDAQILSQIAVLNKDFTRLNTDASQTPPEFQSLAGSLDVEFVLAKQDPEGFATNGIVRVQGTQSTWSINDNYKIKSQSYWPAEDYLNIWVCNLSGLLGYAQFPVSNLPGLDNSSDNRWTDGVVIAYNAFGSDDYGSFSLLTKYRKGRTTTHEVGHFFGLRHTWGDDDGECDGSDYVNDTPNQGGNSSGCPTVPQISCGVSSMYQNFLDYTDDACMNLFTINQVERMITVLESSPRRASLLTSHGLSEPMPTANDIGVREIISPLSGECSSVVTPIVDVRNYGSNTVTSTTVSLTVDGVLVESKNFIVNLSPLASTTLNFSPIIFTSGTHTVSYEVVLTNNVTDVSNTNNIINRSVIIPETTLLPITENFNSPPSSWQIVNPDSKTTWQLATAPNADPSNTAMKMDFYNYEDNLGEIDLLITPVFDLTDETVALLLFDVAYARFQDDNDGLKVVVLSNCNADVNQGTVVYDKAGATLETRSPTTNEFVPTRDAHWRNEFIDLSAFAGQSNLQLAFVGINDWGNNLYLDNVTIVTTPLNDVALKEVISPRPVVCSNQITPKILVQNSGTLVTSVKARATVNGQNSVEQTYSGLNLFGGSQVELELPAITLSTGQNTVFIELLEPNGLPDANPSNNTMTIYSVVSDAADIIPIRLTFEEPFEDQWTIINPSGGMNWDTKRIESNTTLFFNAFNNSVIGDESWLVSPVLDFSDAVEASLSFDLSYAFRGNLIDQLQVLVSTDCGLTYTDTLFDESRTELAKGESSNSVWEPSSANWRRVKLDSLDLAGEEQVRIAFVFTNGNSNNIYLDNIEFYVSAKPTTSDFSFVVHPNPFRIYNQDKEPLQITFDLDTKGPVVIEVIDLMGRVLISETPSNVLNQTYRLFVPDIPAGTYVIRAMTDTGIFTDRVIILK